MRNEKLTWTLEEYRVQVPSFLLRHARLCISCICLCLCRLCRFPDNFCRQLSLVRPSLDRRTSVLVAYLFFPISIVHESSLSLDLPRPWHDPQSLGFASSLPPFPLHRLQMTFFLLANFVLLPLYSSSNVTLYGCSTSSPLLGFRGPVPLEPPPFIGPPMPNICASISSRSTSAPIPPRLPASKADMPCAS